MRSLLLFGAVLAAFAGTAFGALKVMDSGDDPAVAAAEASPKSRRPLSPPPAAEPKAATRPQKSAAERSGDRWVNQAESICNQLGTQVGLLMQNRTPQTTSSALYRKVLGYEQVAVRRLHRLNRPFGRDRVLADRLLSALDRHVAVFDATLDAIEAQDRARIDRSVAKLTAVSQATQRAAADLGAFSCAGVGPLGSGS